MVEIRNIGCTNNKSKGEQNENPVKYNKIQPMDLFFDNKHDGNYDKR
jgi:hypothetical protein